MAELNQRTIDALLQQRSDIQTEWVRNLDATGSARGLKPGELEAQTSDFLGLVAEGCARSRLEKSSRASTANWRDARMSAKPMP